MPMHDWTRVPSGLFHDFHQSWSIRIKDALNAGRLPKGLAALVEQKSGPLSSDVLAIETKSQRGDFDGGGLAVAVRPTTSVVRRTTKDFYAARANRVVIRQHLGRILAVIEIVSPGNKDSRVAITDFVEKTIGFLKHGIHVLVIDLFPPTPRDPFGIHKAIWDWIVEEPFTLPAGKDRILASYETGGERAAYVEPVGVGDQLAEMPLFLTNTVLVNVPLESTYVATWEATPEELRVAVETGVLAEHEPE